MNITYVSTYPPIRCGIANYTKSLARALLNTGPARVTVITEQSGQHCADAELKVIPSFNRDGDYVESIMQHVCDSNPEIVHLQHDYSVYGFGQRFFNLIKKIRPDPIVTMHEVHTPETVDKITYGAENLAGNHAQLGLLAKRIVVHSDAMKEWLIKYGVESERVEVIPHGTPVLPRISKAEAKRRWGFSEDERVLLSIGFIRRSKNERLLVEVLPDLLREVPGLRLLLVGSLHPYSTSSDIEEAQARRLIVKRLRLEPYVRFVERYLDDDELLYALGCADLIVFLHDKPYIEVSGALHLGIGAGKPIVATAVPRFEEVKRFSPETILMPGDKHRLVEVASRILTDEGFANDLARRTLEYAEHTSWMNVAQDHYRLYWETLKAERS
ncbi:MAG: glycosyltransferase [Candidatus Bathyarchaeia archaeon]